MTGQDVSCCRPAFFHGQNLAFRKIIYVNDIEITKKVERNLISQKVLDYLTGWSCISGPKGTGWIENYDFRRIVGLNELPYLLLGKILALCIMGTFLEFFKRSVFC